MNKNKLLSIGEISKYTGAGIKALRYYDKINILKPAYVDPETERRYYSFNQTYIVGLIMFCVELDVPLKELSEFIDGQEVMNLRGFLSHGKEAAQKKIKALEKGLSFVDSLEQKIAVQAKYPLGEIYTQEHTDKNFYAIPYKKSFENIDECEMTKLLLDAPFNDDEINDLFEYGLIYERTSSETRRYVYIEMPNGKEIADSKVIPGGTYYCRQSDKSQIEQAAEIFKDYLAGRDSYIAIETEVFSGTSDINKPINELRVLAL